MDREDKKCVVVFNEEGEPVRWGFMNSEIIKRFMENFVYAVYDTKEVAKYFCGKAFWC